MSSQASPRMPEGAHTIASASETGVHSDCHQYITFRLGQELFAISVLHVREVLDLSPITRVPQAPSYLKGIINVRGHSIPIIDLRQKFGLEKVEPTVSTRILVLELSLDGEVVVVGGIADSVHHVIEIPAHTVNPAPSIGLRWRTEFIQGIANDEDQCIILLDIVRVFSSEEVALVTREALISNDA